MKTSIKGYLAALINTHRNAISSNVSTLVNSCNRKAINELNDLLVFVTSIPEEPISDTYIEINRLKSKLEKDWYQSENIVFENIALKKRVAELEESCENMNEIEKNLHNKIEQLEENTMWLRDEILSSDKKTKELKEVNSGVWEENRKIKLLNKQSFKKIKILKNVLKNKLKGDR